MNDDLPIDVIVEVYRDGTGKLGLRQGDKVLRSGVEEVYLEDAIFKFNEEEYLKGIRSGQRSTHATIVGISIPRPRDEPYTNFIEVKVIPGKPPCFFDGLGTPVSSAKYVIVRGENFIRAAGVTYEQER